MMVGALGGRRFWRRVSACGIGGDAEAGGRDLYESVEGCSLR